MRFPDGLSAERFLSGHWQKQPLFMPRALSRTGLELSGDELAWLATLDDVESRLIFTEGADYRVLHGPFDEKTLRDLPDERWTLLVQDVEKHLPDFRALFSLVDFIPDWRVDDLMVSFAAPGGGVGPHRDNYDVFLCQGMCEGGGSRNWRLASVDDAIAEREHDSLELLAPFDGVDAVTASAGDVLYLPPGVPHWGVAIDNATTYSIGMRAPTTGELLLALDALGSENGDVIDSDFGSFYRDPDLQSDEAVPGQISRPTIRRVRHLLSGRTNAEAETLALAFGMVVTGLKDWLRPEPCDQPGADRAEPPVAVHGMARLAWYHGRDKGFVFANGRYRQASGEELSVFRDLCRKRAASGETWHFLRNDGARLATWLLQVGALDPEASGP